MSIREYDWVSAHELDRLKVFKLGENNKDITPHEARMPKVIALHPSIRLDQTSSPYEYQELIIGLGQLAKLSGRAVVFPDVPCNTSYVRKVTGRARHIPLALDAQWFPRFHPSGVASSSSRTCQAENASVWSEESGASVREEKLRNCLATSFQVSFDTCLNQGKGMLQAEFEHLQSWYGSDHPLEPGPHNTVFQLDAGTEQRRHLKEETNETHMDLDASPAAQIVLLTGEEAERALREFKHQRVLYVGHPVQVLSAKEPESLALAVWPQDGGYACPAGSRKDLNTRTQMSYWGSNIQRWLGNVTEGGILLVTNTKASSDLKDETLEEEEHDYGGGEKEGEMGEEGDGEEEKEEKESRQRRRRGLTSYDMDFVSSDQGLMFHGAHDPRWSTYYDPDIGDH
eukprot:gene4762-34512_t